MLEVKTNADAIYFLNRVLYWIGAYYGGNHASYLVAITLRSVETEEWWNNGRIR